MIYDGEIRLNESSVKILHFGDKIEVEHNDIILFPMEHGPPPRGLEFPKAIIKDESVSNLSVRGKIEVIADNSTLRDSDFYNPNIEVRGNTVIKKSEIEEGSLDVPYNTTALIHINKSQIIGGGIVRSYKAVSSVNISYLEEEHDWRNYEHSEIIFDSSTMFMVFFHYLNSTIIHNGTMVIPYGAWLTNCVLSGGMFVMPMSLGIWIDNIYNGTSTIENSTFISFVMAIWGGGGTTYVKGVKVRSAPLSFMMYSDHIFVEKSDIKGTVILLGSDLNIDKFNGTVICFDNSTFEGNAEELLAYNSTVKSIVLKTYYVNSLMSLGPFESRTFNFPLLIIFLLSAMALPTRKERIFAYILSPIFMLNILWVVILFGMGIIIVVFLLRKELPYKENIVSCGIYFLLFAPSLYTKTPLFITPIALLIPVIPFLRRKTGKILGFILIIIQAILITVFLPV